MNIFSIIKKLNLDYSNRNFLLISGPCVIESYDMTILIAEELKKISEKYKIPFVFKASYEKANRSGIESFTGPGLDEGLKILEKIKKSLDLKIITDVHESIEIEQVAEIVDIIQIPAFLSRQTKLLLKAAETGLIVNIKKAQFMSYADMLNVIEKIRTTTNDNLLLTERGTSFGYNNLVVDFRGFMEMKSYGYPVIYDVSHSLQKPSAAGKISDGQPQLIKQMSMAAVATNSVDGLFIETHPSPKDALSDAKSMLPLDKMEDLVEKIIKIKEFVGNL